MFAATFSLFQESSFFGWLIDNHEASGWEETSQSWLFAAIVIAVVCAGLAMFYKWLKKHSAKTVTLKIWSRGQSAMLMLAGMVPVLLMMTTLWYTKIDYFDVVGVGGLMKGIVLGWFLYLLLIFFGHLLSPWRREIL